MIVTLLKKLFREINKFYLILFYNCVEKKSFS